MLKKLPCKRIPIPVRVIRLYKEGEPLLHPKFAEMVRYAKSSGHKMNYDAFVDNIAFFYEHRKQCEMNSRPTPRKNWDSITLWNFQQTFLKKQRLLLSVLSCPKCGILKQGVPEDIDEFAEEILENM